MATSSASLKVDIKAKFVVDLFHETTGRLTRISDTGAFAEGIFDAGLGKPVIIVLENGDKLGGTARQLSPDTVTIKIDTRRSDQLTWSKLLSAHRGRNGPTGKMDQGWVDRPARTRVEGHNQNCTLADGSTITCRVLDMSTSGLGIATNDFLPVGDVVKIGMTYARVVRKSPQGYGLNILATAEAEREFARGDTMGIGVTREPGQQSTSIFRPIADLLPTDR